MQAFIGNDQLSPQNYTLGLDIGVASVGWCLVEPETGIIGIGVRMFSPPETGEKKNPVGKEWRSQRLARRTIRRRRLRMSEFRKLFNIQLGDKGAINEFKDLPSPWDLRADGLKRPLSRNEWLYALYHILRHRGPNLSNTRIEGERDLGVKGSSKKNSNKDENGADEDRRVIANALNNLKTYKECYRTPGEYIARDKNFHDQKRNRQKEFISLFPRSEIRKEIEVLFEIQRDLHTKTSLTVPDEFSDATKDRVLALFDRQRPPLDGNDLERMVGLCTFEWKSGEKRAPKNSPTSERFILLSKINALRIVGPEGERSLSPNERNSVVEALMKSKMLSITYGRVRKIIEESSKETISFPQEFRAVMKNSKGKLEEVRKDLDKKTFVSLPGRKKLSDAIGEEKEILENETIMNEIVQMISLTKDEDELRNKLADFLREKEFGDKTLTLAGKLSLVSMSGFVNLSLVAMQRMLGFMEKGLRYDEAAKMAGYSHYQPKMPEKKTRFLPPIPKPIYGEPVTPETVNNPVVYRALNQARKVVNAIIKEFGPLSAIRVETASDISKSGEERLRIEKEQNENRRKNEQAIGTLKNVTGKERMKRRLYEEQGGKCIYTGEPLDINASEIDHIYPRSRSMDDSYMNKVLVTTQANREKGDTPLWTYLSEKGLEKPFLDRVTALKSIPFPKKKRLLDREPKFEGMTNADLANTRYATRFFLNYINACLLFKNGGKATATNGRITSILRRSWGLSKNREVDDTHHALDAAVIAFCDQGMVQRVSEWFKWRETWGKGQNPQERPPFPDPHPYKDRNSLYSDLMERINKITISRSVRVLGTGAANKDTILSVRDKEGRRVSDSKQGEFLVKRIPLGRLSKSNIENLFMKDDPRNKILYDEIRRRFAESPKSLEKQLFRNVDSGPLVKSVKIVETKGSGLPLRGGWTVDGGKTIRTDVFRKDGKFFLVPVYVSDATVWRRTKKLPDRYVPFKAGNTIDGSFEFLFSLYPNSLVEVRTKKKDKEVSIFGYFSGIDISTGTLSIRHPNTNQQFSDRPGGRNALFIKKFSIDILGHHISEVTGEKRHGLEIYSGNMFGKNPHQESSNQG